MSQKNLPKNSLALAATLAKKNGVSSHFFYSATLGVHQAGVTSTTPTCGKGWWGAGLQNKKSGWKHNFFCPKWLRECVNF